MMDKDLIRAVALAVSGGLLIWRSLQPETKQKLEHGLWMFLEAANRREPVQPDPPAAEAELSISEILDDLDLEAPAPAFAGRAIELNWNLDLPALKPQADGDDAKWRQILKLPAIVELLGGRGGGKTALAFRLLEICRYARAPHVIGFPAPAVKLLPDWIGTAETLEELPRNCIALIDEAYLSFHARASQTRAHRQMSESLGLSRQRNQVLIFVSQEARQIDKNISSSASVVAFKELQILQLLFERSELRTLAQKAEEGFRSVAGDRRGWTYVYAPNANVAGMLRNDLPTFWKPGLSNAFADGEEVALSRPPRRLNVGQKIAKAKELRALGWSIRQIAGYLGVSKATVINYLNDYPYRKRRLAR